MLILKGIRQKQQLSDTGKAWGHGRESAGERGTASGGAEGENPRAGAGGVKTWCILYAHGIPFAREEAGRQEKKAAPQGLSETKRTREAFERAQAARIRPPREITEQMARGYIKCGRRVKAPGLAPVSRP